MKLFDILNKRKRQTISIIEFSKTFKKIFPIITKYNSYQKYINELIEICISLIKKEKKIYLESTKGKDIIFPNNNDNNDCYIEDNLENGELSALLSILLTILISVDKTTIQPFLNIIENEIICLIDYSLDKKSKNIFAKLLAKIIYLSNNKDKNKKILSYINILLTLIEKETEEINVQNYFEQLKEIIDKNDFEFLNKSQLNFLFDKLNNFMKNLEIKRNLLIEKEKTKINHCYKKDEFNDELFIF